MIVTTPPTADPVSKMLTAFAVSLVIKSGSLISIFPPVLTEPLPVAVPAPVNIEASVNVIFSPLVSSTTAPPSPAA